jgi:hypothetical protein
VPFAGTVNKAGQIYGERPHAGSFVIEANPVPTCKMVVDTANGSPSSGDQLKFKVALATSAGAHRTVAQEPPSACAEAQRHQRELHEKQSSFGRLLKK